MADLRDFLPASVLRQLADEGYEVVKKGAVAEGMAAPAKGAALSQGERWKLASDHMGALRRERDARNRADPAWCRANFCAAAQELLRLQQRCPELFERVLPWGEATQGVLLDIVLGND